MLTDLFEEISGGVTAAKGFKAAGVAAGVKYIGKKDIALLVSETEASVAGVYTTNKVKAAPLKLTMQRAAGGRARALVVNSGNANACNGDGGMKDALSMGAKVGKLLGIPEESVLVASTGVIGQPMPMDKILPGIENAARELTAKGGRAAAEAILTTDTELKECAVSFQLGGKTITLGGMAKGSGMIHPNMATMLAFITTDAAVTPQCLDSCLKYAVDKTFNMISVDGDTSTNDMLLAMANGVSGAVEINTMDDAYIMFREALVFVCTRLAMAVARDGEGATRLIEAKVVNAASEKDARLAARAVTTSNLFKAAVFGQDANWGRILCAVGYSGAEFDQETLDIYLGDVMVAKSGCSLPFDEKRALEVLADSTVTVLVDLKSGTHQATAWGCDLTYEYVRINGSYRT